MPTQKPKRSFSFSPRKFFSSSSSSRGGAAGSRKAGGAGGGEDGPGRAVTLSPQAEADRLRALEVMMMMMMRRRRRMVVMHDSVAN
jgi:hypothetical protein